MPDNITVIFRQHKKLALPNRLSALNRRGRLFADEICAVMRGERLPKRVELNEPKLMLRVDGYIGARLPPLPSRSS